MISNKILSIKDCYFNLPDDFNGSLGNALMLLAKYRLEKEMSSQIIRKDIEFQDCDCYKLLMEDDNSKCSITYGLFEWSDDNKQWNEIL